MKKFIISFSLLLLAAWAAPAEADLVLTLSSGSSTVVVIDDSASGTTSSGGSYSSTVADSLAGDGVIGYSGAVGSFIVTVNTGLSSPLIGPNEINLNSIAVSGAPGTLAIQLLDTDFSVGSSGTFNAISELGGTTDASLDSVIGGALDSNMEVGFGVDTSQGPFSAGPFSGLVSDTVSLDGSFSMNTVVTMTHTGAGQVTSFDHNFSVAAIPEPATGALLFGFVCLVGLRRRRKPNLNTHKDSRRTIQ